MLKPRISIVSCDYDGTIANYYTFFNKAGIESFEADMKVFRNQLYLIKVFENLDRVYFSLNTTETRMEVLEKALSFIFKGDEWLRPGPQFIAGNAHIYDEDGMFLSKPTKLYGGLEPQLGDKLGTLAQFALLHSKEEKVISVTHIEDGRDYCHTSLDILKEAGIDTHIVNLPSASNRQTMLSHLRETMDPRMNKHRYYNDTDNGDEPKAKR